MVVLIVENDPNECAELSAFLEGRGHTALAADGSDSATRILKKHPLELVLLNLNGRPGQGMELLDIIGTMDPAPSVIVTTDKATMEDAVQAMKRGAHDFWTKPVPHEKLDKTLEWLESKLLHPVRVEPPSTSPIITQNPAMMRLKAIVKKVAPSNATVFIQGESGTGKELFARYIHRNSDRSNRVFLALNCAALPEGLLESELFGYEKGAFTGAIRTKEGKFELAHTGTLLLDEVTEIPVHLQAKLLRILQENEVDRVGGKYPIPVDVRVIATTNIMPEDSVRDGRMRKDLYYRLNVIPLKVPPLRDRREDVELLGRFFLEKYNRIHKRSVEGLTADALKLLQDYPWPGNVRELENIVQRAVLLSSDRKLTPECLVFDHDNACPGAAGIDMDLMPICEMEKRLIYKALETVSGNRTRAAEILGISVRTLRNKLNEYRYSSSP